jgi:glycerophosphoryl diester phosphodiesterase
MAKTNRSPTWIKQLPIAHRGLHSKAAPENSLEAFALAAQAGYAIELDIHRTIDGQLIVVHDDTTLRVCGVDMNVRTSKASFLRGLQLFDSDQHIPLLSEVLDVVNTEVPLLIEVKTGSEPDQVCGLLLHLLSDYKGVVAVMSFDPFILRWLKQNAPYIIRGQLSGSFRTVKISVAKKTILRSMAFNRINSPDFIGYEVSDLPSRAVNRWLRKLDAPLLLWPVRNYKEVDLAKKLHANIIFEQIRPEV